MANHLTPEELSKELSIDRQEVIRVCVEESIPIYQGKIDKTLFDTIYHEHLDYHSVGPLQAFYRANGFELIDVLPIPSHGFVHRMGVPPSRPDS